MELSRVLEEVEGALRENGAGSLEAALEAIADAFGAATATLHRAHPAVGKLHLVASRGMPERLIPVTREIPFGKGMAGLCAERREPVTLCNLQTDVSLTARPSAKETGVAGAIVVPVFTAGGRLVGTLGIGKPAEHAYTEEEQEVLFACARALGAVLESFGGGQ